MKLKLKTSYSQRDPRWSNILLGFNTSKYTIGTDGCLITCITNYLNSVGKTETPATINEKIKGVRGFVNGGYLDWGAIERIYGDTKIYYTSPRFDGVDTPDSFFESMKELVEKGYTPILEVDFSPMAGEQMHWVLVYGYDGDTILISDPWTGEKVPLDVYGDPKKVTFMFRAFNKTLEKETDTSCKAQVEKLQREIKMLNGELNDKSIDIEKLENRVEEYKQSAEKSAELAIKFEKDKTDAEALASKLSKSLEIITTERDALGAKVTEFKVDIERLKAQDFTLAECITFIIKVFKKTKPKGGAEQ